MLYDIDCNPIEHIPHKEDYDRWRARLDNEAYSRIIATLHETMDKKGDYFCSSFIPGNDWTGTPYEPIYYAVDEDWDQARFFFGLLCWEAVQLHRKSWSFGKYDFGRDRIYGITYFQVNC